MRRPVTFLVAWALLPLLLAACGGGGGEQGPPPPTWVISGTITGDAVERVLLQQGGEGTAQTESDSFGAFAFPPVAAGTYSVTPVLEDVTFNPPSRIVVVVDADVTGVDFISSGTPPALDDTPPVDTVRLVFVHHSCRTNWLNTNDGVLGNTLGANNYYVRDVSYSWDAPHNPDIGSQTDIGHWYTWFADTTAQAGAGTIRDNICGAPYTTNVRIASYTPITDPGGENDVILVKSCYPNSAVQSDNLQPPSALWGQPAAHSAHTLSNCKEVYRQILAYFKTKTDKLFVIVTAPPLVFSATSLQDAANARALNDWIVHTWLVEGNWEKKNVAVFDFFNVLTDVDNHHRLHGGVIEHSASNGNDFSDYGSGGDSHPTQSGNMKGTTEFVPLLNVAYHRWQTWLHP